MPTTIRALGYWREITLLMVSVTISYLFAEVGYRAFQYATLPGRIVALGNAAIAGSSGYVFDAFTGYRYPPNQDVRSGAPYNSHWSTNRYGHVSTKDYPREKPDGEYRIAVIGDSFTANITNNIRWTELLESELKASSAWRAFTAGKRTRVLNFGVDGMGMVQFAAMLHHHALGFAPDLVIVNFIVDDMWRKLTYRRAPDSVADMDLYVRDRFLSRVDWFSFRPELVAATVGRLWGMRCTLPLSAAEFVSANADLRYSSRAEALDAAAVAISSILADAPRAIFLQAALKPEVDGTAPAEWKNVPEDLAKAVPGFRVISMRHAIAGADIDSLFIIDGHYTDRTTELYGRAVAQELIDRFSEPGPPSDSGR
jgi:hypothetical protein